MTSKSIDWVSNHMIEPNPNREIGPVFVGRQRGMDEIRTALDDAMSGRGRLILLAGEPGIGKTRMAQELADTAGQTGGQVLWGRCHEGQGRPPYWPWIQLIRAYIINCDPERLAVELRSGAAIIAEVVPEIGEKIPDLPQPPALEPDQARFRLFDAVTAFLKNAAVARPLVLMLEDLQWADTPSLLMLEFLNTELRETRLLILGTYRDAELPRNDSLSHTLGELARQQHFREFLLQGLSNDDVNRFMAGSAGVEPLQELVRRVFLTTEGNPLFMTQIVQLLVHQGRFDSHDLGGSGSDPVRNVEIPQSVRLAIRRRLSRLPEDSLEILRLASVIGREFNLDQLTALNETAGEERVLQALEEPLTDRVIEELPRSAGRYQFTHALIQDTLYQELSPTRKVRLHATIAKSLEDLYGENIEIHAAELAYHYAEAEAETGPHKMVHYDSVAGEWALSAYAYNEALAYFNRALAGKEGQPMDADTANHLFGLARAQGATGQVDQAWVTMERAFDYFIGVGDVSGAVAAAEFPLFYVPGLKNAARMVTETLTLVPAESPASGRLLSRLGLLLNLDRGDYEQATEVFNRALAIARKRDDAALEMRTEAAAADADFYRLNWVSALEKSEQVIVLAQGRNDLQSEAWPRWLASFSSLGIGRGDEALTHATFMLGLAERLHNRGLIASSWIINGIVSQARGDWESAKRFYGYELAQGSDAFGFLAFRAMLHHELGRFTEGEADLKRCMEILRGVESGPTLEYGFASNLIPMVARITGVESQLDAARASGEAVRNSPSATTFFAIMATSGLAMVSVLHDDEPAARQHYAELSSYRGTMSPWCLTAVDRVLGLLSQTMGDLEQALEHFGDSMAFCKKAGYRPELAWTFHDHAGVLLQRAAGDPADTTQADRDLARSLLEEGLALSQDLGMTPVTDRMSLMLAGIDVAVSGAPRFPDGLSQREVEVLGLLALGRSNREIGEELFIASSTVARHVSNIFTKTGVSNRAEAATYASRQGLVS